jgi:hypothetical protein
MRETNGWEVAWMAQAPVIAPLRLLVKPMRKGFRWRIWMEFEGLWKLMYLFEYKVMAGAALEIVLPAVTRET